MVTRIAIIRHGCTSWNKAGRLQGYSDIPLDDEGLSQARKLGQRLASEQWDVVCSSHLIRARQTAAIVAEELGIDSIWQDIRIGEAGGGQAEGTTEAERLAKWGPDWKQMDLGMETNTDVLERGLSFLEDLITTEEGKQIVLVTHGSFIRQILAYLLPEMPPPPPMGNTSVTRLEYANGEWTCHLFNSVTHLEEV
ncbi:histidine phosphatase family protein [Chitinophaga flava]|uniref:histidine phosphatase family protein n=1 Tax=Chitinophaga flava TaxID=2259036 RepID=UPI001B85B546|nr:histidine phosphatase family protein [Chitinophaga flava]